MVIGDSVHKSVMTKEVIEMLSAAQGGLFLDCTLGGAGHTKAILDANSSNKVWAIDRDEQAVNRAKHKLADYEDRLSIWHSDFAALRSIVSDQSFDGILADLGISSDQLEPGRGFSFKDSESFDMRMDTSEGQSAAELINRIDERRLFKVLKKGGVGAEASLYTKLIVKHRPFKSAKDLADTLNKFARGKGGAKSKNPVTTLFQAIRIEVNQEFEQIESLLELIPSIASRDGGRVVIICFHSLEDKVVTSTLRGWAQGDNNQKQFLQNFAPRQSLGRLLTKKATLPSESEVLSNPRARSARLRAFEFNLSLS